MASKKKSGKKKWVGAAIVAAVGAAALAVVGFITLKKLREKRKANLAAAKLKVPRKPAKKAKHVKKARAKKRK